MRVSSQPEGKELFSEQQRAILPVTTCAFVGSGRKVSEDVQHQVRRGRGEYTD
jgi:hypothetical protein